MLKVHISLTGEMASGKTRAAKAIAEALKNALPDKSYDVTITGSIPGGLHTDEVRDHQLYKGHRV